MHFRFLRTPQLGFGATKSRGLFGQANNLRNSACVCRFIGERGRPLAASFRLSASLGLPLLAANDSRFTRSRHQRGCCAGALGLAETENRPVVSAFKHESAGG